MISVSEIGKLWPLACDDAGYRSGIDAVLYIVPGDAATGESAVHVEPGSPVVATEGWPLDANQVRDANSSARRDLHRIFVRDLASPRVAVGRLRHELEHGRQYDRSSEVYFSMSFARDALSRAFEVYDPPSLKGGASLYNMLPFEEDANRAAARLTARHFGSASDAELESTDGPLFRDQSPIEADSLALRTLAFAALFPDGVAWVAEQRGETVLQLVAHLGPDAPAAWRMLGDHPQIADFGRTALERCPSEEEIATAPAPPLAWTAVKEQLALGKAAAEALLGEEMPGLRLN
jgi:hypothetical protein